jgi:hypothetical protein
MRHLSVDEGRLPEVDCGADPSGSLAQMFVTMVQGGRIAN